MHNEAISRWDDNYSIIGSFDYLIPYYFLPYYFKIGIPKCLTVKIIETENLTLIIHYWLICVQTRLFTHFSSRSACLLSESRRELAIFDQTHVKEHTKYVAKWWRPPSRRNRAVGKFRYSKRVTTRVKGAAKGWGKEVYRGRDTRWIRGDTSKIELSRRGMK